jgi:hypothetical protein
VTIEGTASARSLRRGLVPVAAGVLVVLALVAITVLARARDDDTGGGHRLALAGRWNVTGIASGSQHLAVPISTDAYFLFAPSGRYVTGYDGTSSYDCETSRSGNSFALSQCVSTANVRTGQSNLEAAVVHMFGDAFRHAAMSVAADGPGRLAVQLGGTTFACEKQR